MQKNTRLKTNVIYPVLEQEQKGAINLIPNHVSVPADQTDVWEIDASLLKFENKITSGSYGDLYKGSFCSQDVAIKVLRTEHLNDKLRREFAKEIFITRRVRHKNIVQFIGACTRPPSLCIVTEFMCGGSMFDFLHKQKQRFNVQSLLRVAIDISKGMNYLYQNNIVHRDLKATNLLMDENGVVKVSDFGIARVQDQSGVMTAETGTYRWMAPEMVVEEMDILTTVFLRYDKQKIICPNSFLATKAIGNYYRSPDMDEVIDFCIHISTPMEKITIVKDRIKMIVEANSEHWHPNAMVIVNYVENMNKINISLSVAHNLNYQRVAERLARRTLLIEEMLKIFKELQIEYHLLPLDVHVQNLPPLVANRLPSTWTTY